ncbi:unnamed protein product [Polarella glacialis]|uniref:ATP-dependent RNA helicase A n=1 Tax=Polarella glacialis TaxID=89957 RepID=A0A813FMG1_POLGL|nr:unnamed protein product [Polarella glacialis]
MSYLCSLTTLAAAHPDLPGQWGAWLPVWWPSKCKPVRSCSSSAPVPPGCARDSPGSPAVRAGLAIALWVGGRRLARRRSRVPLSQGFGLFELPEGGAPGGLDATKHDELLVDFEGLVLWLGKLSCQAGEFILDYRALDRRLTRLLRRLRARGVELRFLSAGSPNSSTDSTLTDATDLPPALVQDQVRATLWRHGARLHHCSVSADQLLQSLASEFPAVPVLSRGLDGALLISGSTFLKKQEELELLALTSPNQSRREKLAMVGRDPDTEAQATSGGSVVEAAVASAEARGLVTCTTTCSGRLWSAHASQSEQLSVQLLAGSPGPAARRASAEGLDQEEAGSLPEQDQQHPKSPEPLLVAMRRELPVGTRAWLLERALRLASLGDDSWPEQWAELAKQLLLRAKASRVSEAAGLVSDTAELVVADPGSNFGIAAATAGFLAVQAASTGSPLLPEELEALAWTVEFSKPGRQARELRAAVNEILDDLTQSSSEPEAESPESSVAGADARLDVADAFQETLSNAGHLGWLLGVAQPWLLEPRQSFDEALFRRLLAAFLPSSGGAAELRRRLGGAGGPGGGIRSVQSPGRLKRPGQLARPATETTVVGAGLAATRAARLARLLACTSPLAGDDEREEEEKLVDLRAREEELQREVLAPPRQQLAVEPWSAEADGVSADVADDAEDLSVRASTLADSADTSADEIADKSSSAGAPMAISTSQPRQADAPPGSNWYVPQKPVFIAAPQPVTAADLATDLQPQTTGKKKKKKKKKKTKKPQESAEAKAGPIDGSTSNNLAQKVAEEQGKAKPGGTGSSNLAQKVAEKQGKAKPGGPASSNPSQKVAEKQGKAKSGGSASSNLAQEVSDKVKSAAPQEARAQTASELVPGGGKACAQCGARQSKDNFSKNQWSLKEGLRKCKTCVGTENQGKAKPEKPEPSNPSQKVAEKQGKAKPGGPASSNPSQKVAEKLGNAKPGGPASNLAQKVAEKLGKAKPVQEAEPRAKQTDSVSKRGGFAEAYDDLWNSARQDQDLAWDPERKASIASDQAWDDLDMEQAWPEDLARAGKPASIASNQAWADNYQIFLEDLAREGKPASIASDQAWAELDIEKTWPEDLARAVKPASIASDQAWAELDMEQTWPEDLAWAVKPASIASDQAWAELDMDQTWPEDLTRAVKPASIATDQAWAELDMEQTWPEDLARAVKPASIATDQAWAELDMEQTWPEDLARAVKPASIASDQAWAELDMEQTWPEDLARAVKPASIATDQAWAELDMEQTWPEDLARAVKPASIAASDQAWAELDMEQTWPEDLARAVKPELEDQEDEEELEEELRRQMEEELLPRLQNLSKEPLPIEAWREEISRRVRQQRVTVLVGATGCGKSTKLPQYLVDEPGARVLVTQPRRMAAVEIARRVASERGEALGQNVGYRIGGETLLGSGKLQFATIGYVLAWFLGKPEAFSTFTHIVIDEVHERSADMELFLLLTKLLMHFFKGPKVILMSATIQAEVFTKYFLDFIDEQSMAPVVVPGRTFPVREVYLDELVEETEWCHSLPRTALDGAADAVKAYEEACEGNKASGKPAMKPGLAELALRLVPLLAKPDSTLLVFLPGLAEIGSLSNLFSSLEVSPPSSGAAGRYKVFVMHSTVPRSEQAVLASNIAESSLTLPDVTAVIDFGLHREVTHDAKQGLSSLSLAWCSQAKQRAGRAGRTQPGIAVRLFPRRFFKELCTEKMPEYDTPEILRTSLSKLFLRAKKLSKAGAPRIGRRLTAATETLFDLFLLSLQVLLRQAARSGDAKIPLLDDGLELDLKSAQAILGKRARARWGGVAVKILELAAAGALAAEDEAAEVTSLGLFVEGLPLEIGLCRLIWLGSLYGCVVEATIMAAACSSADPFTSPSRRFFKFDEEFVSELRRSWLSRSRCDGGHFSEPIMWLRLFCHWAKRFESQWAGINKGSGKGGGAGSSGLSKKASRAASCSALAEEVDVDPRRMQSFITSVEDLAERVLRLPLPGGAAAAKTASQDLERLLRLLGKSSRDADATPVELFRTEESLLRMILAAAFSNQLLVGRRFMDQLRGPPKKKAGPPSGLSGLNALGAGLKEDSEEDTETGKAPADGSSWNGGMSEQDFDFSEADSEEAETEVEEEDLDDVEDLEEIAEVAEASDAGGKKMLWQEARDEMLDAVNALPLKGRKTWQRVLVARLKPSNGKEKDSSRGAIAMARVATNMEKLCGRQPLYVARKDEKSKFASVCFSPDPSSKMKDVAAGPSAAKEPLLAGASSDASLAYMFSEGGPMFDLDGELMARPASPYQLTFFLPERGTTAEEDKQKLVRGVFDVRNPVGFACHVHNGDDFFCTAADVQLTESRMSLRSSGSTIFKAAQLVFALANLCPTRSSLSFRLGRGPAGDGPPGAEEYITAIKVLGWEVSLLGDDRGRGGGLPAQATLEALGRVRESLREALCTSPDGDEADDEGAGNQRRRLRKVSSDKSSPQEELKALLDLVSAATQNATAVAANAQSTPLATTRLRRRTAGKASPWAEAELIGEASGAVDHLRAFGLTARRSAADFSDRRKRPTKPKEEKAVDSFEPLVLAKPNYRCPVCQEIFRSRSACRDHLKSTGHAKCEPGQSWNKVVQELCLEGETSPETEMAYWTATLGAAFGQEDFESL